ncbi:MAG: EAL domain-containing protein [Novosphingobium sp.]|nr:EAL domain-containing protein [Novosphingobium sp.]
MNARLGRIWPLWNSRRFRIGFYAILAGLIAGSQTLLLPVEDVAINLRSALRSQSAPQNIVVISVDDHTLNGVGARDVTHGQNAQVIRRLLDAGAKRVFYDRPFRYEEGAAGDRELITALAQSKGKVFLPAFSADTAGAFDKLSDVPLKKFRKNTEMVGATSLVHPFGLGISFPLEWETVLGKVPSMSAKLADRSADTLHLRWLEPLTGMPEGYYRPDYSYDPKTVPTLSFIDVMRGNFDEKAVAGKDMLIGPTSRMFQDFHDLPMNRGEVAGVYLHVIAAHTFAKPWLMKLGWLPAMLLVSGVVIAGLRRSRTLFGWPMALCALTLAIVPFILDGYGIEVEIAPALLTGAVALVRSWSLRNIETARDTNVVSGLPSLQQLRTSRNSGAGSLIALKLRNYGAIVASFDNGVEERLAQEIARRVRLGDTDAIIYHEGDKFVWMSQIENPVDVLEHLEGLHQLVQGGILIEGREVDLSFNCGVDTAQKQSIEKRIASALQSAEQAVREDELVSIHNPDNSGVHWEISLLSALDRAIDAGDVWVAYQPKLDLASGRIKSAEALARWTDPERGPVSPEKFIQIAEEYHRIDRITRFILGEAVRTVRELRAIIPDFTISVNISAQLLRYAGLPEMILSSLRAHDMPPDCLVLEITETDRLDRSSKTYAMMENLVASGFELSIDDFGTGNATIDYLRLLPAVEVKIDKVFVKSITHDSKDKLLIQSIIEMAHSLDRRIVAEGVENAETLDVLASLGCDQIQGYYIGRPERREDLLMTLDIKARTALG